jgi:hypothetical protein
VGWDAGFWLGLGSRLPDQERLQLPQMILGPVPALLLDCLKPLLLVCEGYHLSPSTFVMTGYAVPLASILVDCSRDWCGNC